MVYIEHALRAHIEMVNLVNFGVMPEGNKSKRKKMTAASFRAFATEHNAQFAGSA